MKKKKSFGQHFLIDEDVAYRIVEELSIEELGKEGIVLEIGPGEGVLTKYLVKKENINFFAIEIDRRLPAYLLKQYPQLQGRLINEDVLKLDWTKWIGEKKCAVIGNFPYNISTQILFKVLTYKDQVQEVVGMFQREVAQRVASEEGSKVYGVISVLIQAFYDVEYLFTVPPQSFDPPPKVHSGVIRLKRHHRFDDLINERNFRMVVKTAFSQRRKKMANACKSLQFNKEDLPDGLFDKRAEQLSVETFILLSNALES